MIGAEKTYENVLFEQDGPVAYVTMNRPNKRNALSLAHMRELIDCFTAVGESRDVSVVVLRGEGPAFSAGHDLSEMIDRDPAFYRERLRRVLRAHAEDTDHPAARDRPGPRHRDRRRLSARGHLRPRRRLRRGPIRDAGRKDRAVLLHPDGCRLAAP